MAFFGKDELLFIPPPEFILDRIKQMQQYLKLGREILADGIRKENRTGTDTIGIQGHLMKFNLSDGFPIVTAKKTFWKSSIAEMLSFIRGYSYVDDFKKLGCNVWDANANSLAWTQNINCRYKGDLGRIYGVQARDWHTGGAENIDQLKNVYNKLLQKQDDRRLIVNHWNPGELNEMSLPPCHLLYQFGIHGDNLNLSMYQRSADYALGVPFNIVGYAWLLSVMAQITGFKVGTLNHFIHDAHVYVNHIEGVKKMVLRKTHSLPQLKINPDIKTLADLEIWVTVNDFELIDYVCNSKIDFKMAV